jgi:predicted nuclease of predicted toxin-antitoxin system
LRFLADVNIEKPVVDELERMGHNISWVTDLDRYLDDMSIFEIARKERRILLTNDKDFGEIVFRQKLIPTGIVLFRVKGQDVAKKVRLVKKLLAAHSDKIAKHFVVVAEEKVRFIPL